LNIATKTCIAAADCKGYLETVDTIATCQPCATDANCKTCDAQGCLTCPNDFLILNEIGSPKTCIIESECTGTDRYRDNDYCKTCPDGYSCSNGVKGCASDKFKKTTPSGSDFTCVDKADCGDLLADTDKSECVECPGGYSCSNGIKAGCVDDKLKKISDNGFTCVTQTECENTTGYVVSGKYCVEELKCPTGCTCAVDSNVCIGCTAGFYNAAAAASGSYDCQSCLQNCGQCTSASDCSVCEPDYFMKIIGTSISCINRAECGVLFASSSASPPQCVECPEGYSCSNGVIAGCASGKFKKTTSGSDFTCVDTADCGDLLADSDKSECVECPEGYSCSDGVKGCASDKFKKTTSSGSDFTCVDAADCENLFADSTTSKCEDCPSGFVCENGQKNMCNWQGPYWK